MAHIDTIFAKARVVPMRIEFTILIVQNLLCDGVRCIFDTLGNKFAAVNDISALTGRQDGWPLHSPDSFFGIAAHNKDIGEEISLTNGVEVSAMAQIKGAIDVYSHGVSGLELFHELG